MKYLWGIGREAKKLLENHYISIKEFDGIIDLRGGKYREGGTQFVLLDLMR